MKLRLLMLASSVALLLGGLGCESFVYSYDCRGTLLKPDGSPASCVQVHVDTKGPPGQQVYWDGNRSEELWDDVLFAAVTNPHGRFRVHYVGEVFTSWFFNPYPEAPKLREVYVWFKHRERWSAVRIPLTDKEQFDLRWSRRRVTLPPVTLPE